MFSAGPSVRAASAWMHSPIGLPSPSGFHSGMSSVSVQQLCEYFNRTDGSRIVGLLYRG